METYDHSNWHGTTGGTPWMQRTLLWLFRFIPIGFFYGPKEPAHVKIPIRAVYRRRSVVKIAHTVWICEFKDALSAAKFVSCEKKEKDYNEST